MRYVTAYLAALILLVALDFAFLSLTGDSLYRSRIGEHLLPKPLLWAAAAFYLIYVAGIVFFAVDPALVSGSWTTALMRGAILGFVAYGTYDLTNQALMRGWPLVITMADMSWGAALTGVVATASYLAAARFG
jgi:uncharacterized membrane protein